MTKKTLVSVILPCLNEKKTIERCITWAKQGLRKLAQRYKSEIIVVDNGSTDRSRSLARRAGAKVVVEKRRGYGSAYKAGLAASHGTYIIIGDSDGTYDFRQIPRFIRELEKGADLVLGSRLTGTVSPGAMPFTHRYLGNPILTSLLNIFYARRLSDSQTGFRAFTKRVSKILNLQSNGMEFASEMIVKAIYHQLNIS